SDHGFKHFPQKNMPWNDIVKSTKTGAAKYKPGMHIESLERIAWENGTSVTNAKPWKVFKSDNIIGAKNGIETPYMRIEMSANTIHGHPITPIEYHQYLK